jgi:hypothetical protein
MITKDFYNIIDSELSELIEKYKDDKFIKKHKSAISNQKSYALLIWFLEFYGRTSNYTDFITDGDNDSSCDIVFDKINNQSQKVFYIVQSKWNNENNSEKDTNRDEILKALNDFETIWRGEKENVNEKLKVKLEQLDSHLKENGEVKFIFLTLSQYNGGANENINAFQRNDDKIKFEVIDINRIRSNYIDRKYKGIEPLNPLESYQNPEENEILIDIIQKNGNLKIEKPFEAYIFLLRPKSIYELFEKYSFALFHKNVRNPLLESQFNEDIEKTAIDEPAYFWYYNNGITAITYFLPTIGKKAEKIRLTGLQIINGAQTVYSIYRAYKNASPTKRMQMDTESLVTLRLLKSGGKSFDLNVTRYTNSQNPVQDRDFCANDDIQIKLQNASYKSPVWYEKRRGEFREVPKNITKVPNYIFANVYLAYHLQAPVSVLNSYEQGNQIGKDLNFISHREHKDGLYEKIFNEETKFEDMLSAFYISDTIFKTTLFSYSTYSNSFTSSFYHLLALFKVVFTKYLQKKYKPDINVNNHIIRIYEKREIVIILKTFKFVYEFVTDKLEIADSNEEAEGNVVKFFFEPFRYEQIKEELENMEISVNQIEDIILSNEDKQEAKEIYEKSDDE